MIDFKLNDRPINFKLESRVISFALNDGVVNFKLNAVQEAPIEGFFRLLETGFYRLLEDGGRRLLETAVIPPSSSGGTFDGTLDFTFE